MLRCICAALQVLPHTYLSYFRHLFGIFQHDLEVSLSADDKKVIRLQADLKTYVFYAVTTKCIVSLNPATELL